MLENKGWGGGGCLSTCGGCMSTRGNELGWLHGHQRKWVRVVIRGGCMGTRENGWGGIKGWVHGY